MTLEEMKQRKGAVRLADIPQEILHELNRGTIPTVNLVEWLGMDQRTLATLTLPEVYKQVALQAIDTLKTETALNCIKVIGAAIYKESIARNDQEIHPFLASHTSDMLRCWAAIFVGEQQQGIVQQLSDILPFATDEHFGVREISWIAIRDQLMEEIEDALPVFKTWVGSDDPYQRRFVTESIRPKGVWCRQFKLVQEQPELALPFLDALQSDPHKYVQDSVANWLNDASKSQPHFVQDICKQWKANNPDSKATAYIIKRALRSLK